MPRYKANYTDADRKLFGQRVSRLMADRGWTAAELARYASKHMPRGREMGRDSAANYARGGRIPTPVFLKALAAAFGVPKEMLVPRDHQQTPGGPPPLPMLDDPDHTRREAVTRLVADPSLPLETAMQMVEIYLKASQKQDKS
jgi:transcriptional regulator with XRE-family HTH domain